MLEDKQRELLTGLSKRVILNCTRQWGKSWMAAVALLFHALHHPDSLSLVAGPTLRQSAELLKKVKDLTSRISLITQSDTINRQSIVLPNRSRIVAIPGNSSDSIRGFSGVTMLVIDEASMVKDEIYTAARPMLTQKNGSIWLLSTPKDTEGFFHREFTEGTEDWRRVVVPATECPRFTPEQLASEEATLGARKFAQEFLCEFVSTNDGMFCVEWFDDVFCPDVQPLALKWEWGLPVGLLPNGTRFFHNRTASTCGHGHLEAVRYRGATVRECSPQVVPAKVFESKGVRRN